MSPLIRARTVSVSVSPGFWTTLMGTSKNPHLPTDTAPSNATITR